MEDDESMIRGKQLVFRETGKPNEVLEMKADILISQNLGGGEVLVRIAAAPSNAADLNTGEGTYCVKLELPATPGIDGFGVVEATKS